MIEISLIALKFAALVVGGIFAAIGLLTDYRHEDGRVSKWGKIALFGIILSTIIAAGTQAVESYRDRQTTLANDAANRKSEKQTQDILRQVRRAIYPLHNLAVEMTIVYPADAVLIQRALKELGFADQKDETSRFIFFDRQSPTYPSSGVLRDLIEPHFTVGFWRKGRGGDPAEDTPDLTFDLDSHDTIASLDGRKLDVTVKYVSVPADRLEINQTIASLEDLRDGQILMIIGGGDHRSWQSWKDVFDKTTIEKFRLYVDNHAVEIVFTANENSRTSRTFEGKISFTE
jgi:hypothetical protein